LITWHELRSEAVHRLRDAAIDDADQDVLRIAEQAGRRTRAELVVAWDAPATEREVAAFDRMVARRATGEPLQYVLGRWGFRTLDVLVDRRVLIPRPETELVAGTAIEILLGLGRPATAADLGTGSGVIALSIAAETWPRVDVWATDASAGALEVARANLAGLGRRASVVRLAEGDWFAALPAEAQGTLDVVVSNPPYVASSDPLPAEVARWEPAGALVSGATGLEAIERILADAPVWLAPGGAVVLEIGDTQADAVIELARAAGFAEAVVRADLTGRDRILVARREPGVS
jgi:release factor glutamine methyltransferase